MAGEVALHTLHMEDTSPLTSAFSESTGDSSAPNIPSHLSSRSGWSSHTALFSQALLGIIREQSHVSKLLI